MRPSPFWLCLVFAASALGGCASLAPPYQRPVAPVASQWALVDPTAGQAAGPVAAEIAWQDFFADARLRQIVATALRENRDLRATVLSIERARALYQGQRAGQFPFVDASASFAVQRTPSTLSATGDAFTSRQYGVGVGVSAFELDFFGRARSLSEAALQQFLATEEARRATQISVVAEVATAYLVLAADQERLKLAHDTLASQRDSYRLTLRSYELGASSGLERAQAQTTVDAARADVAGFSAQVAQDLNALTLIVGAPIPDELLPQGTPDLLTVFTDLPAGVPSQVLQQRPDVLQAERTLQAAQADIGAARAAFFPSISLTGSFGKASADLGSLFGSNALTWSFLPTISLPIFDAGLRRANLEVSEAMRDIAVAGYEKAIQTAFREVADALAARSTLNDQLEARQSLVDATVLSQRLSNALYRNGVSSYLELLDAQRSLYSAQQGLISVRLALLSNRVTVYRVLGGGWRDAALAGERVPGSSPSSLPAR
jgi:multidrug efflux system outer membrane protein